MKIELGINSNTTIPTLVVCNEVGYLVLETSIDGQLLYFKILNLIPLL